MLYFGVSTGDQSNSMKRENAMNTDQKHPLRWLLLAWLGVVYLQRLLDGSSGPRIPLTDVHIPLPALSLIHI